MWAQFINTVLGIWLTAAPQVLGYGGVAADHDHIVGPTIASLACAAIWQVTRGLRWANLVLGAWLLVAPWVVADYTAAATINDLLVGGAVAALSLVKGRQAHRFGGGWRMLLSRAPAGNA